MGTYSSFQEDTGSLEYKKLNFGSLYLYHTQFGPKANQEDIIAPKNGLGRTIANNWEVYDGVGPGSKLVARAQGLHIEAGNWHNSFSLVFEDGRYMQTGIDVHALLFWEKKTNNARRSSMNIIPTNSFIDQALLYFRICKLFD